MISGKARGANMQEPQHQPDYRDSKYFFLALKIVTYKVVEYQWAFEN